MAIQLNNNALNNNAVREKKETIASNESLKSSMDYLKKTLEKKLIQLLKRKI